MFDPEATEADYYKADVTPLHPALEVPEPPIPMFEGRVVDAASITIRGTTPTDDIPDIIVSMDDRVRLVGEYKVVAVRHFVDPRTGGLVREQVLKPMMVTSMPWNAADPNDDGVIRAL